MSELIDPQDLEDLIWDTDSDAEYYGEYAGRGGHMGYAVTVSDPTALLVLGAEMRAAGLEALLRRKPHVDSLGRDMIVSWPKVLFSK